LPRNFGGSRGRMDAVAAISLACVVRALCMRVVNELATNFARLNNKQIKQPNDSRRPKPYTLVRKVNTI
jgi:hypothetical protein